MSKAQNVLEKTDGEDLKMGVDFGNKLASGVTLASGAAITSKPPGLTFSGVAINSTTFSDPDGERTIAANEGVVAVCTGGKVGQTYEYTAVAVDSDGQTREVKGQIRVV